MTTTLTVLPARPIAGDGRPLSFSRDLLSELNAREVLLDLGHSALLKAPLGEEAPAAGWLKNFRYDATGALVADVTDAAWDLRGKPARQSTHPHVSVAVRLGANRTITSIHSVALVTSATQNMSAIALNDATGAAIAFCSATESVPAPLGWREAQRTLEDLGLHEVASDLPGMMLDPDQRRLCDNLGISYAAFLATAPEGVAANASSAADPWPGLGEFVPAVEERFRARIRELWPEYKRLAAQLGVTLEPARLWNHFQLDAASMLREREDIARHEAMAKLRDSLVAGNAAQSAVAQLDADQLRMCELLGVSPAAFARTRGEL